jgi:hypothetical protein
VRCIAPIARISKFFGIFAPTPDDGPQKTTVSGESATSTVLVAQLTVAEDTLPFIVRMNVQGRSTIRAEAGVQAADAKVD